MVVSPRDFWPPT